MVCITFSVETQIKQHYWISFALRDMNILSLKMFHKTESCLEVRKKGWPTITLWTRPCWSQFNPGHNSNRKTRGEDIFLQGFCWQSVDLYTLWAEWLIASWPANLRLAYFCARDTDAKASDRTVVAVLQTALKKNREINLFVNFFFTNILSLRNWPIHSFTEKDSCFLTTSHDGI